MTVSRVVWMVFLVMAAAIGRADDGGETEPVEFRRMPMMLRNGEGARALSCAAFSNDGRLLAIGDSTGRIVVREAGATEVVAELTDPAENRIDAIQFLGAEAIASLHSDGRVLAWSISDRKVRQTLPSAQRLAIAYSGTLSRLFVLTAAPALESWQFDAAADTPLNLLATENLERSYTMLSNSDEPELLLLAAENAWQIRRSTDLARTLAARLPDGELTAVEIAPDGRTFATGLSDGKVRVRDAKTGGLLHSWQKHPSAITDLTYSHTGMTLISSCDRERFRVWDLRIGELTNDPTAFLPGLSRVELSPNDQYLVALDELPLACVLEVHRPAAEQPALLKPETWNGKAAFAVRAIPDRDEAVVAAKFGTPQLVNLETGEATPGRAIAAGERLEVACCSAEGAKAAYAYPSGIVHLYDVASGELLQTWQLEARPNGLAFAPDARHLAITDRTHARIVDCETGAMLLDAPVSSRLLSVDGVGWSADAAALYLLGVRSVTRLGSVSEWSAETGEFLRAVESSDIMGAMHVSSDGSRIVTGGITGIACIFDADLNQLHRFECGGRGGLHSFCVLDERRLAVGTYKGSVLLMDMTDGREISRFEALPLRIGMPVRAIDVNGDRTRMIAVGGYDDQETMRIYALDGDRESPAVTLP